jgi:hypothetical protein
MREQRDREEANNQHAQNDARSHLAVHRCFWGKIDSSGVTLGVVISAIGSSDARLESFRPKNRNLMVNSMNRRDFLATCATLAWLVAATNLVSASTGGERPIEFLLKETAGLRRFGYPVHVTLPLDSTPPSLDDEGFALKRDGQDIPAQFRRVTQPDGTSVVSLDFNASAGSFDVSKYAVHHNLGFKLPAVKGRGMNVERNGSTIDISNSSYIKYAISDDLAGFVRSVKIPSAEFIKGDSSGLFVVVNGQKKRIPLSDRKSTPGSIVRIGRQGPLAVGLQAQCQIGLEGSGPVASLIDLSFPSSKSWIETVWTLSDPQHQIEAMGLDLGFLLDDPPILLDCGAKSTVYVTLKERELMTFEAGDLPLTRGIMPSWVIRQGSAERSEVLAMMRRKVGDEPEGWVHVIDRRRCTAMAVADFGQPAGSALDRFEFHGNGRFQFERRFLTEKIGQDIPKNPIKRLRFWLHFVTTPVQIGAVTSPQAMLAPLVVEWIRP